mmetsp:Transcript_37465/g.68830  ORF Transcript_37465/g.68830 Transcript_37465/m.68830 type:complete len:229 (-) Transcript_37465:462-1148(-)
MMRSMTLLSSTVAVAVAMASDSVASNAQQLWYPDFASDYESGSCTTSPSPALLTFALGSISLDVSTLAQSDNESCCETWFPDQELCGCLGGCPDENDAASAVDAAPTAAAVLAEEHQYWYPQFDITYEDGKCVKAGVNIYDVPPSYYTKEGGFLHVTMDGCCQQWFGHQQGEKCSTALVYLTPKDAQPMAYMTGVNDTSLVEAVVESRGDASVYYKASRSALAAEESL